MNEKLANSRFVRSIVRAVAVFATVVMLSGCGASHQSGDDQAVAVSSIVTACTDLVLDYALYRDQRDLDRYSALFSEDAVLKVQGLTFNGRSSIYERIKSGAPKVVTRHLMSTIRITPVSADRATGISYVTVYAGEQPVKGVARVEGFAVIGNYVDEFVRTELGWRIKSRVLEEAFRYQAEQ